MDKQQVIMNYLKFKLTNDDFMKLKAIIEYEVEDSNLISFEKVTIPTIMTFILRNVNMQLFDKIRNQHKGFSSSTKLITMVDELNTDMQVTHIVNEILSSQLRHKLKRELLELFDNKIIDIHYYEKDQHDKDLVIYDFMAHLQPLIELQYKVSDLTELVDTNYVKFIEKMDQLNWVSDESEDQKDELNGIYQQEKNDDSEDNSDQSEDDFNESEMELEDVNQDGIIDEKDLEIIQILNGETETELTKMIGDQYLMLEKLIELYKLVK